MAYTDIDNSTAFFQTVIYTGNGATGRSITTGMQPDWVWLKSRGEAEHHQLSDSVRGVNKQLYSHLAYAEATETDRISAFNSDGFTIENDIIVNKNNVEFVAWNWAAGGSASSNSDGSITSSVSANTTAGFSIVSYTATNANATVGHGLGSALDMLIVKNRDSAKDWRVWFKGFSGTERLELNNTEVKTSTNTSWNGTVPSSSVFSLGDDTNTNNGTDEYIAYCFAGKQGYSKFGTYEGNGNDNGPFIYTGFAPAFVMVKCFDQGEHWNIYDNKRGSSLALSPNLSNADRAMDDSPAMELLSNGFKIRTSDNNLSNAADGFIYMAFAAEPFVTSKGVPATAK